MRALDRHEMRLLPVLPIILPASNFPSDPFSRSSHRLYRPSELRVISSGNRERTREFLDRLLGMFAIAGLPIPYVFRTADGAVRSLDAGCMGMLSRPQPLVMTFDEDSDGHIRSIRLSGDTIDANESRLDELARAIAPKFHTQADR